MAEDLHNYEQRLKSTFQNLQDSDQISEENKQLAQEFKDWLSLKNNSYSRDYRYIISMKKVMEYNDFSLDNLEEDEEGKRKIRKILAQIQNSAYYHKEYKQKTKVEYNNFVQRLLEFHDLPSNKEHSEILPETFKGYVPEKDKERTDSEDLPIPSDIEKLARYLQANSQGVNSIRMPAILLTLWDTAARIGECLSIRIGSVKVNGKSITVKVPGNKESPDRKVPCAVAAPILKHWLENGHPDPENPDAFLFPNLKNNKPEKPASYSYFTRKLRKAYEETETQCKIEGEVAHIFRKGRISYLKKAELMSESMIDTRVGHIQGSDETRTYTRIDDDEAGENYLSGYGMEDEADASVEEDVLPLRCKNCQAANSGHRKSCRECGEILDEDNYLEGVEVESEVRKEVEEKTHKLNRRIVKNETAVNDDRINEEARTLVAEEKGIEPSELEW